MMMYRYCIAVTAGLFLAMPSMIAQDTLILDQVIAKIGGEVIFHSEVEEKMAMMRERRLTPGPEDRCLILESLMAQALLVHYARIDSVEVRDEEVESQIDARMNQILATMGNDRKLFQEYYGQTVNEMKDLVRDDTRHKLLAERMQAEIMNSAQVTPNEVVDFFNTIPKDSLPYFNAEVELAEIVILPEINAEERTNALEKIRGIKDQLAAGEDFATLARRYSEDGSARDGGYLGTTNRKTLVPEFEAAAYQLEEGEISDIVETEFGFHLIQLIQRKGLAIESRHILIRPQITEADRQIVRDKLETVKREIEGGSITFGQAVTRYGDKRVQSHSNSGRIINPKTSNTFFETGDVDSEIFFSIDTLDVGGITSPIEYRLPSGDYLYKIVQLQSRTAPHRANLRQDYNRIQEAARESKRNTAFNDWVEKQIPDTYIMLDYRFEGCPGIDRWKARWMGTRTLSP